MKTTKTKNTRWVKGSVGYGALINGFAVSITPLVFRGKRSYEVSMENRDTKIRFGAPTLNYAKRRAVDSAFTPSLG